VGIIPLIFLILSSVILCGWTNGSLEASFPVGTVLSNPNQKQISGRGWRLSQRCWWRFFRDMTPCRLVNT